MILLLYTVTITPVRLGFEKNPETWSTEFWMETFIDICFMVDVFLNCITSYEQDDGHMVVEPKKIIQHYLRTWFICDLLSSMPFDLIAAAANNESSGITHTSTAKTLKTGKISKVLRLLKLSKMLRVARAFKLTSRLEEELDLIGRAPMKIAKLALATLFMSHIFACGWAGMARINGEGAYYTNSWVSMWGVVDGGFTKEYLSALYVFFFFSHMSMT